MAVLSLPMRRILRKCLKWALFTVLLGVLSLMSDGLVDWFFDNKVQSADSLSSGELLIISAAIVAGGIGELVFDRKSGGLNTIPVVTALSISVIFVALLGICYGAVRYSGGAVGMVFSRLSAASWVAFGVAVVISTMCVILSELEP